MSEKHVNKLFSGNANEILGLGLEPEVFDGPMLDLEEEYDTEIDPWRGSVLDFKAADVKK